MASPELTAPPTRLQAVAVWDTLTYLINASIFVLIGLQLPIILDDLTGRSAGELTVYAALVVVTVIGVRFAWLFTTPYLVRVLDRRPSQRARRAGAAARVVVAWSGLRGAVSMAAALSHPLEPNAGEALPGSELIVTFVVVRVTVVGQGLTLPRLARRLGVAADGAEEGREELMPRLAASKAALTEFDAVPVERWAQPSAVERVRHQDEERKRRFAARAGKIEDAGHEDESQAHQRRHQQRGHAQSGARA